MPWLFVGVYDQWMSARKQILERVTQETCLAARQADLATPGTTSTLMSGIISGSLMTRGDNRTEHFIIYY